jgi:hypothetical protein
MFLSGVRLHSQFVDVGEKAEKQNVPWLKLVTVIPLKLHVLGDI